jgi:hypothetical protein
LHPGESTFAVMAQYEPGADQREQRLGTSLRESGDYAEDLAASSMLASTVEDTVTRFCCSMNSSAYHAMVSL